VRTTSYTSLRNSILRGINAYIESSPNASTKANVAEAVNDTLDYAWHWCENGWPELRKVAERTITDHVISIDRDTGIDPIGQVLGVYQRHPYTSRNPQPIPFDVSGDGIVISDEFSGQTDVFVSYLKPAPKVSSGEWATTTAYAVDDVVHNIATGECYVCLVAHTSGTFAADLAADKWEIQELPAFLERAISAGALSVLRDNNQGQIGWSQAAENVMQMMLQNIVQRYDFSRLGGQQRLTPSGIK